MGFAGRVQPDQFRQHPVDGHHCAIHRMEALGPPKTTGTLHVASIAIPVPALGNGPADRQRLIGVAIRPIVAARLVTLQQGD